MSSQAPLDAPSAAANARPRFHLTCHGHLVIFSNNGQTATRKMAAHEFNHGIVFSLDPLQDNQMFEVINFFLSIQFKHNKKTYIQGKNRQKYADLVRLD